MASIASTALRIPISATDGASGVIRRVSRELDRIAAPGQRAATLMGDIGTRAKAASRSISDILPAMGVLTSALTIAGLSRLSQGWAEMGTRMRNLSASTGIPVAQLNRLTGAARLAGVSAETMNGALQGIQDTLSDAAWGRSPEAFAAITNFLHIDPRRANVPQVLAALQTQLNRLHGNPQAQARLLDLMRVPREMLPLLTQDMARYQREIQRLSPMSKEQAEEADRLRQSFTRFGIAAEGLSNSIIATIAPSIRSLLDPLTKLIALNRPAISNFIGDLVKSITTALKAVDWEKVGGQIRAITDDIAGLIRRLPDLLSQIQKFSPQAGEGTLGYIGRLLDTPNLPGQAVPGTLTGRRPGEPDRPLPPAAAPARRTPAEDGYQDVPARPSQSGLFHRSAFTAQDSAVWQQILGTAGEARQDRTDGRSARQVLTRTLEKLNQHLEAANVLTAIQLGRQSGGGTGGFQQASFVRDVSLPLGTARQSGPGHNPLGLRNPELVGLSAYPGQSNSGSGEAFARFPDEATGFREGIGNIRRWWGRGDTTIARLVHRRTPGSDGNDEGRAAAIIARAVGIGPNDPLNLNDPEVMRRYARGAAIVEHGEPDARALSDGLAAAMRGPVGGQQPGRVHVEVELRGAPADTRVRTRTSGNVSVGVPAISRAMRGAV